MCDAYTLSEFQHSCSDFESAFADAVHWKNDRMLRPDALAPVMMSDGSVRTLVCGFQRPFVPPMHVVKSTCLGEKYWKSAAMRGRCLIPMVTFFEVSNGGDCGSVHELHSRCGGLMLAAGVWDVANRKPRRFAVITGGEPSGAHAVHRPVILNETEARAYLSGELDAGSVGEFPFRCVELPSAIRTAGAAAGS